MFLMIISSFIIGTIIGIFFKIRIFKKMNLLTWVTLTLLFFMGMEIGSNDELFELLPKIGITGFLISVFAIGGSILFTWSFEIFTKRKIKR